MFSCTKSNRRIEDRFPTIELHKVSFGYSDVHNVIQDLSLIIPYGMHIGIKGENGAGKTTLFHLLLRFYSPTEGIVIMMGIWSIIRW